MNVSVVIPFRRDTEERYEVYRWVSEMWRTLDFQVIAFQTRTDEPWCKARAIQAGVELTDGDILVIADADCWCDPHHIHSAIAHVDNIWARWALPHRRVSRLNQETTNSIILGWGVDNFGYEEPPYSALNAAGGIVVLTRELWNRVPMDPRFVGWGFEDVAWFGALRTLDAPAWRGTADLWHLWHPRPDEPDDRTERSLTYNEPGQVLLRQYKAARFRPGAMGPLVADAKKALLTHPAAA